MARLLRSNIQDCVQEVPVGQMAQGTPLPPPDLKVLRGERGGQMSNTPPKIRRILYLFFYECGCI